MWAVGNIATDSVLNRDLILNAGGLNPLIKFIKNTENVRILKNGTFALSQLCRGIPYPSFEFVKNAIDLLAQVLS